MPILGEQLRNTTLGRELAWNADQRRYRKSRETRIRAAGSEADQLIKPLRDDARQNPGGPEAKKLVLVGANVLSHVVSEVCRPENKFFLNGVLSNVRDWATDKAGLEELKNTRKTFLSSDLYRVYFHSEGPQYDNVIKATEETVSLFDALLFGAVALDKKGMTELDNSDKRGETNFGMQTFIGDEADGDMPGFYGILPHPKVGIFSYAEMGASSTKGAFSIPYSNTGAGLVSSIATGLASAAVARSYGIAKSSPEDNSLFQERINEIIKQTLNPQLQD